MLSLAQSSQIFNVMTQRRVYNQVNDRFGAHDLAKGVMGVFGVWEDTRSADLDIYFAEVIGVEVPILEIISIVGGIGVTATIKNTGTAAATDVELGLTVTGGLFGLINKETTDTITTLAVDAEETVTSGLILGLGPIAITVTATADGAMSGEESADAKVLFFIVTPKDIFP